MLALSQRRPSEFRDGRTPDAAALATDAFAPPSGGEQLDLGDEASTLMFMELVHALGDAPQLFEDFHEATGRYGWTLGSRALYRHPEYLKAIRAYRVGRL